MRNVFMILAAVALFFPATAALAQQNKNSTAAPAAASGEVTAADVAAVAVYREAMNKLRADLRAARTEIKEKNIALAKALGKTNGYSDREVTARHTELMAAQQRLAKVELNGLLLFKKYNPNWKPDASGRKVGTSSGGPSGGGEGLEDDEV